jgi:hypothetical protein
MPEEVALTEKGTVEISATPLTKLQFIDMLSVAKLLLTWAVLPCFSCGSPTSLILSATR